MATKLETLAELEGFQTSMAMLEANITDSVVPGICVNAGCDYSTETEPDSDAGWCEMCDEQSVKSCMVLADII